MHILCMSLLLFSPKCFCFRSALHLPYAFRQHIHNFNSPLLAFLRTHHTQRNRHSHKTWLRVVFTFKQEHSPMNCTERTGAYPRGKAPICRGVGLCIFAFAIVFFHSPLLFFFLHNILPTYSLFVYAFV